MASAPPQEEGGHVNDDEGVAAPTTAAAELTVAVSSQPPQDDDAPTSTAPRRISFNNTAAPDEHHPNSLPRLRKTVTSEQSTNTNSLDEENNNNNNATATELPSSHHPQDLLPHDDGEEANAQQPLMSALSLEEAEEEGTTRRTSTERSRLEIGCNDDEHDELVSSTLTKNTYSLIYVCDPRSSAFVFALSFFCFQATMPILAMLDLIDLKRDDSALKIPAGVPIEVRIAGFLTLIFSVPYFTDTLDAVEKLHEGYNPSVALSQTPHALYW